MGKHAQLAIICLLYVSCAEITTNAVSNMSTERDTKKWRTRVAGAECSFNDKFSGFFCSEFVHFLDSTFKPYDDNWLVRNSAEGCNYISLKKSEEAVRPEDENLDNPERLFIPKLVFFGPCFYTNKYNIWSIMFITTHKSSSFITQAECNEKITQIHKQRGDIEADQECVCAKYSASDFSVDKSGWYRKKENHCKVLLGYQGSAFGTEKTMTRYCDEMITNYRHYEPRTTFYTLDAISVCDRKGPSVSYPQLSQKLVSTERPRASELKILTEADERNAARAKSELEQQQPSVRSALLACRRLYHPVATSFQASITIDSSGSVNNVDVSEAGSGLENCLRRVLKIQTVSPFTGSPVTVIVPVSLSP